MLFLLLCILSSTGIFTIFKLIDRRQLPPLPIIVINYLLATVLGFVLHGEPLVAADLLHIDWLMMSILIGILFIIMFFLVAWSSARAGISITTVASKMSVVFPMVFSMLIDPSDRLSTLKLMAIFATLLGVGFTVYRKERNKRGAGIFWLPLLLFAGMGIVDSLVKFAQHNFVADQEAALFSAVLFLNAWLTGMVIMGTRPARFRAWARAEVWFWGLLLGAVNFGSIFFMVRALNYRNGLGQGLDSSAVFGMNNTGIVALSVLLGLLVFKEKLRPLNWVGIGLSCLALILFSLAQ
jgi:drug/metabolite transporter (DMT)-like permease